MEITPAVPAGRQVIESYGAGRFTVSGAVYVGAVLVFPERTLAWEPGESEPFSAEALAPLWQDDTPPVELLLLGCGARLDPVPPALREQLREAGISAEPMDTGAACRTYNVLLAEARRVAAALLPVD